MRFVNLLIKPASSLCNLRCRYCFYECISNHREEKSMGVMSEDTVRVMLENAFRAADPGGTVSFMFQGGEPTVAGLPFFQRFAAEAEALSNNTVIPQQVKSIAPTPVKVCPDVLFLK